MVRASIADQRLTLELQGLSRLFALKSRIEIPLSRVRGVCAHPVAARNWWHTLRERGERPGGLIGGTLYQAGKRMFWDVKDPDRTVLIEVEGERYEQLVVEVADPEVTAESIARAIAGRADAAAAKV